MHAHDADDIVELHPVEHEILDKDHRCSADRADRDGALGTDGIATGGDADKSGEQAIHEAIGQVGPVLRAADQHCDDAAEGSTQQRVRSDLAHRATGRRGGAGIEADPPHQEQHRAHGAQHMRMAMDRQGLAIGIEAADARSQDDDAGQRDPSTDGMHHGGTGEIDEAAGGKPGLVLRHEARAPGPMAENRIDQQADNGRQHDIGRIAHALGHGTGDDRRGRAGKGHLKNEEGIGPFIEAGIAPERARRPEQPHDRGAEHDHETENGEAGSGDEEVRDVLLRHIDGVLRADHACFQQKKPGLHQQHEDGSGHHPDMVQVGAELLDIAREFREIRWSSRESTGSTQNDER